MSGALDKYSPEELARIRDREIPAARAAAEKLAREGKPLPHFYEPTGKPPGVTRIIAVAAKDAYNKAKASGPAVIPVPVPPSSEGGRKRRTAKGKKKRTMKRKTRSRK